MNFCRTRSRSKAILIISCIIVLSFLVNVVHAETIRGCYVNGVLYTNNTSKGNRYFYRTGGLIAECGFEPTGTNNGICRLYNSGPVSKNSSYTIYNESFNNKWDEINCPIDDYVWPLMILIAMIAIYKFKRQSKFPITPTG